MSTPNPSQSPGEPAARNTDFWHTANSPSTPAAPVEEQTPVRNKPGGRGYGLTALITAIVCLPLAWLLPHFAAILLAGSAVFAWMGMRRTTGSARKLALAGFIASVTLFLLAVAYTVVYVTLIGPALYQQQ